MLELVRTRRRRTLRRAFTTDCQAVRLEGFRLVGHRIIDLSPRGALIECDRVVVPGEELMLSFRAPKRGPYIDTTAEVRRVFSKRGRPVVGMKFLDLDVESRHDLIVRLAGLPPPFAPERPPIDYAETIRRISLGA
jgi:hypothetical protein